MNGPEAFNGEEINNSQACLQGRAIAACLSALSRLGLLWQTPSWIAGVGILGMGIAPSCFLYLIWTFFVEGATQGGGRHPLLYPQSSHGLASCLRQVLPI